MDPGSPHSEVMRHDRERRLEEARARIRRTGDRLPPKLRRELARRIRRDR